MSITHHYPCLHFHSWHYVQGHNRLLEEDLKGWGRKSLLQGCLVQRDQRHGWCLCVGAVWRDQEVHIKTLSSLSPQGNPSLCLSLNSCDRVLTACGELHCGHVPFCDGPGRVGISDLGYHASSEICIYPIYDVSKGTNSLWVWQSQAGVSVELLWWWWCKGVMSPPCHISSCWGPCVVMSWPFWPVCPTSHVILLRIKIY